MKIDLLYGKSGLVLDLPQSLKVTVIRKHPMTPIEDATRTTVWPWSRKDLTWFPAHVHSPFEGDDDGDTNTH